MSTPSRYSAEQLATAVLRSGKGGDARDFLIRALTSLDGDATTTVMRSLVERPELQAREWFELLDELARRLPALYVSRLVREGLTSRSVEVQQRTVIALPGLARAGWLDDGLVETAVEWLGRRLRSRSSTRLPLEPAYVALAVLERHGPQRAHAVLRAYESRMDRDEATLLALLPPPDDAGFAAALVSWGAPNLLGGTEGGSVPDEHYPDPTATRYVDATMRRLGIAPQNPSVETFVEWWESDSIYEFTIDETTTAEDFARHFAQVTGLALERERPGPESSDGPTP